MRSWAQPLQTVCRVVVCQVVVCRVVASVVDAVDQLAAALVHTTASCMRRCLVGDAEAEVVRFLQVLDGNLLTLAMPNINSASEYIDVHRE